MSLLVWFLYCAELSMTYPVMAGFIQPPQSQSALLNSTATFSCVTNNVQTVGYLVNSMPIAAVAAHGVIQSSPLTSGSQTTVNLTIPAIKYFNNSQVVCLTYLANGTRDDSPPAYLLVAAPAPPSAPLNLRAAAVAGTYVVLTWSPPMDLGIGGSLYYNVSYQAVSGSSNVTSINTTYTNITVTNLYPGVTYMMTVEADNGGSGYESKRSASINVATISPPSAPLNLTAAVVAGTSVVLTWSPPMDLGIGGPLYYNVSYQAVSGSSNVTSINTTYTNIKVTNLYARVTYMMTVEADNGVSGEESKRSVSINVVTTLPTQTSNAWKVGVGLGVPLVVVVVVELVVGLLIYHPPELENNPSTSKMTSFTTNGIPLSPAGKGEEKETPDTARLRRKVEEAALPPAQAQAQITAQSH